MMCCCQIRLMRRRCCHLRSSQQPSSVAIRAAIMTGMATSNGKGRNDGPCSPDDASGKSSTGMAPPPAGRRAARAAPPAASGLALLYPSTEKY
eukprot:scaffold98195_cov28-Tisochrysis_lutea.AAC.2